MPGLRALQHVTRDHLETRWKCDRSEDTQPSSRPVLAVLRPADPQELLHGHLHHPPQRLRDHRALLLATACSRCIQHPSTPASAGDPRLSPTATSIRLSCRRRCTVVRPPTQAIPMARGACHAVNNPQRSGGSQRSVVEQQRSGVAKAQIGIQGLRCPHGQGNRDRPVPIEDPYRKRPPASVVAQIFHRRFADRLHAQLMQSDQACNCVRTDPLPFRSLEEIRQTPTRSSHVCP